MDTTRNSLVLEALYNQLIDLDEQAGCFDEETNAKIDRARVAVMKQIRELEAA